MGVIEIDFRQNELPITHAELRGLLHGLLKEMGELRGEIRIMAETQLQADQDNATAFATLSGVINQYLAAVAALLAQQAAATADPVVLSTTASMQALTATLQGDLAALAPATPATDAPVTA